MSVYLCRHLSVFFCVCVAVSLPVCVPHLPGYHGCLSVYVLFVNSLYRCLCAFVVLSLSSHLSVSFIFLAIMVRNSGKSIVPLPSASTWVTTLKKVFRYSTCDHVDGDGGDVVIVDLDHVHLVDHVLQLGLCGVLAQGPHHLQQQRQHGLYGLSLKKYNMEKSSRNRTL